MEYRVYIVIGIIAVSLFLEMLILYRRREVVKLKWKQAGEIWRRNLTKLRSGGNRDSSTCTISVQDMSPAQYEEHVGYAMQERGFGNVRVMGGTGDFGADVLCTDTGGQKVCVQCKKYSKPVGVSAVQEVIGARGFYGCQRAIVATTTGFTPAARQLAEKNGVELVIIN